MRNKKNFLLLIALAILSFCVAAPVKFSVELPAFEKISLTDLPSCQVIRIINGNTIVVDMNNQDIKVRLTGVKPAEKYRAELALFVKNLLKGEDVYIVNDADQNEPNKYDYYVYRVPDGLFVNAEIIRQGYGLADTTTPFKYMAEFKQLEEFAKERSKGLWDVSRLESISQPAPIILPKTSTQAGDVIVYVTKTGKKYHRAGCSYLSKSAVPMKLSDAQARGYSPCTKCNPPQ